MSIIDILSEIASSISGDFLSGPSEIKKRIFFTFLVGTVSLGASIFGIYHLFDSGQSFGEPEWAFKVVYGSAMGGIISFILGTAYWFKTAECRVLSALAASFGLVALILFPVCLHVAS